MTASPLVDALGTALAVPGTPISYNSTTGECSASWGAPYNLTQAQLTAIYTAFNDLSSSVLAGVIVEPPPAPASGTRFVLTSDVDYYCSPTGSNSNPGTSALPFADPAYAYQEAQRTLDLGGQFKVTVHLLADYTGAAWLFKGPLVGAIDAGSFVIDGGGQSRSVSGNAGQPIFQSANDAAITVRNMTCNPGAGGGIFNANLGIIFANTVWMNTCGGHVLVDAAGSRSTIIATGLAVEQSGANADLVACVEDNATMFLTGAWGGSAAWNSAFAQADLGGMIDASGFSYSGGGSGPRVFVSRSGIILTNGVGANLFPGTSTGTINGDLS
jgi:hypothetical protein